MRTRRLIRLALAGMLLQALFGASAQAQTNCATQSDIPQIECEALVALFNSTNGPGWRESGIKGDSFSTTQGWSRDDSPCRWSRLVPKQAYQLLGRSIDSF